jgi:hypothetical protein
MSCKLFVWQHGYRVVAHTNSKCNGSGLIFDRCSVHIMLRDLLTQKCSQTFLVTDFRYPRACRFRKYQNLNRSPGLSLPTFFKTWFLLHKMWLKLAKIGKNWIFQFFLKKSNFFIVFVQNCLWCVPRHEKCEKLPKIGQFWPILANFGHILWI